MDEDKKKKKTVRIENVTDVIPIRIEDDKGQRLSAYIFEYEKFKTKRANLVIMDGNSSTATKAYVFPSEATVVDARSVKRFIRERTNGAKRVDKEGNRVVLRPDQVTTAELA